MPSAPLLFGPNQQSGQSQLAGASPAAINVIMDGRGAVRRRPGLVAHSDYAASGLVSDKLGDAVGAVQGLHVTYGGTMYAIDSTKGGRQVFRVGSAWQNLSVNGGETLLKGTKRPVFAETEGLVAIAGGQEPQKILLSSHDSSRLGGSPPECTHVITNAQRLLVNDTSDQSVVSYSDLASGGATAGHEVWGGSGDSGSFSAEGRADPVLAIGETASEVFVWGQTSVEINVPDPQDVYAQVTTREYGVASAYGVVRADQAFGWLDHRRRVVVSNGRSFEVINEPVQEQLDLMSDVSDAFAYRIHHGIMDCLVWSFPNAGVTLVYQIGGGWSQWCTTGSSGALENFEVNCAAERTDEKAQLVGTNSGKVYEMTSTALDDAGKAINAYVETGFIDRDTDRLKQTTALYFTLERGKTTSSDIPVAWLSWRDSEGQWNPEEPVELGASGDMYPVVAFYTVGFPYRRRQWRFRFADGEELVLASVKEEFEVLEA